MIFSKEFPKPVELIGGAEPVVYKIVRIIDSKMYAPYYELRSTDVYNTDAGAMRDYDKPVLLSDTPLDTLFPGGVGSFLCKPLYMDPKEPSMVAYKDTLTNFKYKVEFNSVTFPAIFNNTRFELNNYLYYKDFVFSYKDRTEAEKAVEYIKRRRQDRNEYLRTFPDPYQTPETYQYALIKGYLPLSVDIYIGGTYNRTVTNYFVECSDGSTSTASKAIYLTEVLEIYPAFS